MTLEGVSNMGILSYDQNNSCEITMNGCQARKIEMRKHWGDSHKRKTHNRNSQHLDEKN